MFKNLTPPQKYPKTSRLKYDPTLPLISVYEFEIYSMHYQNMQDVFKKNVPEYYKLSNFDVSIKDNKKNEPK